MEAKNSASQLAMRSGSAPAATSRTSALRIGRPGYKVTKSRDLPTRQRILTFELEYPEAEEGVQPRHRIMSAFEQKLEAPDRNYQYLLFACAPYETIAFKVSHSTLSLLTLLMALIHVYFKTFRFRVLLSISARAASSPTGTPWVAASCCSSRCWTERRRRRGRRRRRHRPACPPQNRSNLILYKQTGIVCIYTMHNFF